MAGELGLGEMTGEMVEEDWTSHPRFSLRKSRSVEELGPLLYLNGVST
ncbi:MAG: hypothetical protein ACYCYP_09470 [Leptospirales bacterium]